MISRFLSASPRYAEDDGLNVGGASTETTVDPAQGQGSAEAPVVDDSGKIEDFQVGDVGQAATEETTATGEKPASFYQHDWGESGGLQEWKTREEFDEFFRDGVLRHQDYTNKTKELGFDRERIKSAEQRAQLLETEYLQGNQTQRELKGLLDTLTEQEFRDVIQQVKQKYSYASNPAMKRLDELEQRDKDRDKQETERKERDEMTTERNEVYTTLSKEIPDFDKDAILRAGQKLQEVPPGQEMRELALILHYSGIGKMRSAEYARQIAQTRQRTVGQPVPNDTVGGVAGQGDDYSNDDWNAIAEAAKEAGLK